MYHNDGAHTKRNTAVVGAVTEPLYDEPKDPNETFEMESRAWSRLAAPPSSPPPSQIPLPAYRNDPRWPAAAWSPQSKRLLSLSPPLLPQSPPPPLPRRASPQRETLSERFVEQFRDARVRIESSVSDDDTFEESLDHEAALTSRLHEVQRSAKSRVRNMQECHTREPHIVATATERDSRPPRIHRRDAIVKISTIVAFVLLQASIFALLMIFRQFAEPSRSVAKNSAVLTMIDVMVLLLTINRTSSNKPTMWQTMHVWSGISFVAFSLIHAAAHVVLLYDLTEFLREGVAYYYLTVYPFEYNSGAAILLGFLVMLSTSLKRVRKYRYNVFYFAHIGGWTLFTILAGLHSYFLLIPVALAFLRLYLPRLATRWLIRPCLILNHIGKQFVVLDLRVTNSFVSYWLVVRTLLRNQGNAVIWLSSNSLPGISRFERHPYSMIEVNRCAKYTNITLMISSSGDWKGAFVSKIRQNMHRELYSLGLRVTIDSTRVADFKSGPLIESTRILFLLENIGIASFLAFLRFICDPINRVSIHDRVRTLELHYHTDDLEYLIFLDRYVDMAKSFKFIEMKLTVYTLVPSAFRGEATIVSNRIDHRAVLPKFLASPGKHYIYTDNSTMRGRVNRALDRISAARKRKALRTIVSL